MIIRSPQQQHHELSSSRKVDSTMQCLCPRGRFFSVLTIALAAFALLRFSVLEEPPNTASWSDLRVPSQSSQASLALESTRDVERNGSEDDAVKSDNTAETEEDSDDSEDDTADTYDSSWERGLTPKVVWLASYPNSGTSYTMTLVERASDLSTATNYGAEVTYKRDDSTPIYPQHPEGPFWDGLSGKKGKVRPLPTTSVLTKTHCGGRCVKCTAKEYVIDTATFVKACQRTTHRLDGVTRESSIPASIVTGLVHLIRNPYHNIVARFHLERRNMIDKKPKLERKYPYNATGFAKWCKFLDHDYAASSDEEIFPKAVRDVMEPVPCAAEFYKWTQWHNHALASANRLGPAEGRPVPVHTILYEDYERNFNRTFAGVMEFLHLPVAASQFQSFRNLPTYTDHYTPQHRDAIQALIQQVASKELWSLIQHYFAVL